MWRRDADHTVTPRTPRPALQSRQNVKVFLLWLLDTMVHASASAVEREQQQGKRSFRTSSKHTSMLLQFLRRPQGPRHLSNTEEVIATQVRPSLITHSPVHAKLLAMRCYAPLCLCYLMLTCALSCSPPLAAVGLLPRGPPARALHLARGRGGPGSSVATAAGVLVLPHAPAIDRHPHASACAPPSGP
jgi:hypothetical protein